MTEAEVVAMRRMAIPKHHLQERQDRKAWIVYYKKQERGTVERVYTASDINTMIGTTTAIPFKAKHHLISGEIFPIPLMEDEGKPYYDSEGACRYALSVLTARILMKGAVYANARVHLDEKTVMGIVRKIGKEYQLW